MKAWFIGAVFAVSWVAVSPARADEGMWSFDHLPAARIRAAYGWAPDQGWLDRVRSATVRLSVGCSGSVVSAQGLMMTNHHCVTECLQALSNAAVDAVADGYYAHDAKEEKTCPGLEADRLDAITDVTGNIRTATEGLSGQKFADAERAAKAAVEKACATSDQIDCEVVSLYHGGIYDLYRYRRFQDLRLVWTPEESEADFGGDPDNFNYPRYAIDAAFLRIYENGKPLATPAHLQIAQTPPGGGDLVFTVGNPYVTYRDLTQVDETFRRDVDLPLQIELSAEMRGVLHQFGTESPAHLEDSLESLNGTENNLKALRGAETALLAGAVMQKRQAVEDDLRARIAGDAKLAASYGDAWDLAATAIARERLINARYLLLEDMPQNWLCDRLRIAIELNRAAAEQTKPNGQRLADYAQSALPEIALDVTSQVSEPADLDRTEIAWWLTKLRENLGPDDADARAVMGSASPEQIAAEVVDGSHLDDPVLRARLWQGGPAAINASQDPLLELVRRLDRPARAVRADYENNVAAGLTQAATKIARAKFALFGTSVYPDASFSPRISYGTIAGYTDGGISYAPFTSFGGAFRHATGNEPFRLPQSWTRAQASLDPATELDMVTTNDITGGNSGSPVIDRQGAVVGLVFDGNREQLSADDIFDESVGRTVAVSSAALWQGLAKIYHVDRLVDELAGNSQ